MHECDVLVIGSGVGGLSTAITASRHGQEVLVVEKAPVFGGTTAYSGGVLWIPGNTHCPDAKRDTREAARRYLQSEMGASFDAAAVDAFLSYGPRAVEWFERETRVAFVPTLYPDYHPDFEGGMEIGRSILAAPYDIRELGADMARLRPPLETITFMGMMFNSSNADLKHFFRATKSVTSAWYVARRLARHVTELVRYRRGIQVTSGNALAARLVKSTLDANVPIWTDTRATALLIEQGRVCGATVQRNGQAMDIRARRGVILACGGFPHDLQRIASAYPHVRQGGAHLSPVPRENTGDGLTLAESVGAKVPLRFPSPAAWMPVSDVPLGGGRRGVFPHLLDRYKPGVIAVTRDGKRFCNESSSYHDVGAAMVEACQGESDTSAWLVCDQTALSKYGLGYAKPAPMPVGGLIRKGYLYKGASVSELARACGIDAAGLEATIREFNVGAREGKDLQFGRGTTAFNRYLADPDQKPNPCVAPLERGPYYAVKLLMGDLGTFDGLSTDVLGRVRHADGSVIDGLYAVGNDRASVMGGTYPGAGITLGPNLTFGYITGLHLAGSSEVASLLQVQVRSETDKHAA